MQFLAPALLVGMLAAAIPVIIHFFYRAKYRPQPWGAMRFLKLALEQTSRKLRFQELILMILRALALGLLAFALARPAWKSSGSIDTSSESVDAYLVLDASASMQVRDGTKTRFADAQAAASDLIDKLPAGSTVRVYTLAQKLRFQGPVSPANLDQARERIRSLTATAEGNDYAGGLTDLAKILEESTSTNREVILLTDLQTSAWDENSAGIKAATRRLQKNARISVYSLAGKAPANAAIQSITPQFGIPQVGTRVPFQLRIANTGGEVIPKLTVRLFPLGKPSQGEERLVENLGQGEIRTLIASTKLEKAGLQPIVATLESDNLDVDNRLEVLIPVREQVKVLLVDGRPNERDAGQSASYYVGHALNALNSETTAGKTLLTIRTAKVEDLNNRSLDSYDLCYLCDVPVDGLIEKNGFLASLPQFLNAGKGIVWGVGNRASPTRYNDVLGPTGLNLLPGKIREVQSAPAGQEFRFAPNSFENSGFLSLFAKPPFDQIGNALIRKRWYWERDGLKANVLARFGDDAPALLLQTVGAGEILWVATSLDSTWSSWAPGRPPDENSFGPFMAKTLTYLTNKTRPQDNDEVGQPLQFPTADEVRLYAVVRPDDKRQELGNAKTQKTLSYAETDIPGIYRIEGEKGRVEAQFARHYSFEDTTSLETFSFEELEKRLGFAPVNLKTGANSGERFLNSRNENEWTIPLLIALWLLTLGEFVYAWYCSRGK